MQVSFGKKTVEQTDFNPKEVPTQSQHVENEKGIQVQSDASVDPAMDRRLTHKFDRRILPWLFGLWLLAFIGIESLCPCGQPF